MEYADFLSLVQQRESCRDYDSDRPVEQEKLTRMLEAARLAPSACNSQPWSFRVVTDEKLLPEMRACAKAHGLNRFCDKAPAFIAVVEEPARLLARAGGAVFKQDFASIDIGLATSQLVLAATAQGLSTCILGSFAEDRVKKLLEIPAGRRVRLVLCVGYAATDALRKKTRKPMEEMATFFTE